MVLWGRVDRKDGVTHIFSHDPPIRIPELNLHLAPVFGLPQHRQRPGMASEDHPGSLPISFQDFPPFLERYTFTFATSAFVSCVVHLIVCSLPESQDSPP